MSNISKEIAALDKIIDGAADFAERALRGNANIKQGRLAADMYARINSAIKNRLEHRLNQGKLGEIESQMIEHTKKPDQIEHDKAAS
jgi:hypothetical protein